MATATDVNTAACPVATRTLSTDCARRCGIGTQSVSCVSLDTTTSRTDIACALPRSLGACQVPDYACRAVCFAASQDDTTEFKFYVPFGEYQSEYETQRRRNATEIWQKQVDALPASSTRVPFLGNDFLVQIGTLALPSRFTSINIAGGYSSGVGLKGKVANVSLVNDTFVNATNVTSVSLAHLSVGDSASSVVRALPKDLTRLQLANCLLQNLPSEFTELSSLRSLNLSMNFLINVPSTLTLPALRSLDLTNNNLTFFEATTNNFPNLEILDLRDNLLDAIPTQIYSLRSLKTLMVTRNPLRLARLTPDQYTFLSQLQTLEIDEFSQQVDCSSGEKKTLANSSVSICVTSATALPTSSNSNDHGSKTVLIMSIVGGVVVLMIAVVVWKKLWRTRQLKKDSSTTGSLDAELAKHEPEGSDANGDFVACGNNKQTPILPVANRTPDQLSTSTATHPVASSLVDRSSLLHHSTSSDDKLLSHHSSSTSGRSTNSSNSTQGIMTRTIVISRPLNRNNLSNHSLWDDGELNAYMLKYEDIEDVRLIGSGGHGVVWLVNYRQTRQLASKRLVRDQLTRQKTFDFVAEIKLVAQLHHPSIVEFVGVAWTVETDLQALFEYMPNGDLRTYLEHTAPDGPVGRRQTIGSIQDDADDPPVLSWVHDKWQLALSVSEALLYVHSFLPPLVHRDLKSRNVLLSADMRAKLSDFGVARFESEHGTMSTNIGTGKWLAPEVIAGSKSYDASCDIYAFGVLLSELDSHRLPYDDVVGDHGERLPEIALMQRIAANQLKPTFASSCPRDIVELAQRCLSFEPKDRPTAVILAFDLRTFARKHGYYDTEQL